MALKNDDARYAPHYSMALRVKPHVGKVLEELSKQMAITKTAVLVTALRELAKREGIPFDEVD